jgi:hypothetical protein
MNKEREAILEKLAEKVLNENKTIFKRLHDI